MTPAILPCHVLYGAAFLQSHLYCRFNCYSGAQAESVVLFILLKYVHVISAIVAVGANVTYGIWIVRASRWPENLSFTLQGIKFIDDKIANPAYVMLLITGLAMMHFAQIPLSTSWLLVSMALYVLVVLFGLL
eukprot:gene23200-24575_t